MPLTTPYTFISCPCVDTSVFVSAHRLNSSMGVRHDELTEDEADDDDDEKHTLDPRSARAQYSLYPLEHLFYCAECQEIRCPRCMVEEIMCWYCPSCLFEVPGSMIRAEGNRCMRHCYQCPECASGLTVASLEGPWALLCPHCAWTTKDMGIDLERRTAIPEQLARLKREDGPFSGGGPRSRRPAARDGAVEKPDDTLSDEDEDSATQIPDRDTHFANLKAFYGSQLSKSGHQSSSSSSAAAAAAGHASGDFRYGSPGSLARLVNIYTGAGPYPSRNSRPRREAAREAYGTEEGLHVLDHDGEHDDDHDDDVIERMKQLGWEGTSSLRQRTDINRDAKFVTDLRPVRTMLRTKKLKRCRTCRHILVKPEPKISVIKFKMRLLAKSYIPSISLSRLNRGLHASQLPSSTSSSSLTAVSSHPPRLVPHETTQFLVTLKNPLFDPVQVTLATPSQTPGKNFPARVVILCPQFEIGANTDVWQDALDESDSLSRDGRNTARKAQRRGGPTTMVSSSASLVPSSSSADLGQAEAGKVWERGRNWTTVVMEITPGGPALAGTAVQRGLSKAPPPSSSLSSSLLHLSSAAQQGPRGSSRSKPDADADSNGTQPPAMFTPTATTNRLNKDADTDSPTNDDDDDDYDDDDDDDEEEEEEEEDILEIPLFMRFSYETTSTDLVSSPSSAPAPPLSSSLSSSSSSNKIKRQAAQQVEEAGGGGGVTRAAFTASDGTARDRHIAGAGSGGKGGTAVARDVPGKEKRELAYWMVLGVGKVGAVTNNA